MSCILHALQWTLLLNGTQLGAFSIAPEVTVLEASKSHAVEPDRLRVTGVPASLMGLLRAAFEENAAHGRISDVHHRVQPYMQAPVRLEAQVLPLTTVQLQWCMALQYLWLLHFLRLHWATHACSPGLTSQVDSARKHACIAIDENITTFSKMQVEGPGMVAQRIPLFSGALVEPKNVLSSSWKTCYYREQGYWSGQGRVCRVWQSVSRICFQVRPSP